MSTRLLRRRQWRYLARTPGATAAAVLATALGVASVVAVHLVSERIRDQVTQNSLLAGYTHAIRGGAISADAYFDARDRWRRGATEPIAAMVPVVEGHGTVGGAATHIVGIDFLADTRADAQWEGGSERVSSRDGEGTLVELLRGRAALASTGLRVTPGEWVQLGTTSPFTQIEIVGTFEARERRLLVDIALARELLERHTLTAVWLRAERTASTLDRWLPGSAAAFGTLAAISFGGAGNAEALDATEPTRRFAQALTFNLSALGFLALFVAAFLIYQASYANVARRQRDSERLIAIGVSQATLRRLFVVEGAALGAGGGVLGVSAGWALAGVLIDSPLWSNEPVPFSTIAALKGIIGGVGIGALGAIAATAGRRRRWAAPIVAGLATLLLGIAATANTLAAAFAVILGLTGLQIALVTPAVAALAKRWLFAARHPTALARHRSRQPSSRHALVRRANLRTLALQLDEVSVAVSALTIAIAAAIGVAVMVESFRRDFAALLEQAYWPGVYVEFPAPAQVDAPALAWLEQLPGVAEVRRYGRANVLVNGRPVRLTLVPDDAREAARHGHAGRLGNAVLLSEGGARAYGIAAGASVMLDGGRGAQPAVVAGRFREYGPAVPGMVAAARHWAAALDGVAFNSAVILPDPATQSGADWRGALAQAIGQRFPNASVRDDATLKARALEVFDRSHELSSRLTLIALAVAIAGLYTALSAIAARRRGEQRLLHALGTGRRRIAWLTVCQCVWLGVTAAALATPLGIAIAWALCELVNPRAFGWSINLVLPPGTFAEPVLLGIAAAALAGLAPAWRAMGTLTTPPDHELA